MKKTVLLKFEADEKYFSYAEELLKSRGISAVRGDPAARPEGGMIEEAVGCCAVIAGSETWSESIFARLKPTLKLIVRCGTGYDAIDTAGAARHGIAVANTPGVNAVSVAEMAMGFILNLQRNIKQYDIAVRNGNWMPLPSKELMGKTVGLVGFGAISKSLAGLLAGFGVRILAYDVVKDVIAARELGVDFAEIDDLMEASDVISLHVPLNERTRHLIDKKAIGKMKPTAVIINTSRGAVINEADLADALEKGRIAGAALDVFESEPVDRDHPLLKLGNVLVSPHSASATEETMLRILWNCADKIERFFAGDKIENIVNPEYAHGI
jgi:D-3-phosphoglycerate dehydrogenase